MSLLMAQGTDSRDWQRLEDESLWAEVLVPLLESRYKELCVRAEHEKDETELRNLQGALREIRFMLNRPRLERESEQREEAEHERRRDRGNWFTRRNWFGGLDGE